MPQGGLGTQGRGHRKVVYAGTGFLISWGKPGDQEAIAKWAGQRGQQGPKEGKCCLWSLLLVPTERQLKVPGQRPRYSARRQLKEQA